MIFFSKENGESARLGMESVDGRETIKFELQISDCDVLGILKLIKDCVSSSNEEDNDESKNELDEVLEEDTKDLSENPLDRAKKLGFTYLYPSESKKSFC